MHSDKDHLTLQRTTLRTSTKHGTAHKRKKHAHLRIRQSNTVTICKLKKILLRIPNKDPNTRGQNQCVSLEDDQNY